MSFQRLGIGTRNPVKSLDVSGSVNISESIDVSGNITVDNNLTINEITTLNSTLNVSKASILSSTLDVTKAVTMSSTLTVEGNTLFNSDVSFTSMVYGISKGMVGLGNVNNTNDDDKPVSIAQQTALDLKADLDSTDTSFNLKADLDSTDVSFNLKADSIDVDASLNLKADSTDVDASLNLKADLDATDISFNLKADLDATDNSFNLKADLDSTDTSFNLKADLDATDVSLNLKAPSSAPEITNGATISGDLSLNSGLSVEGDVSFNSGFRFGGDIIPTTDSAFDIGSVDYKIRDLYLSNNSLWIGDDHKIDVEGGTMKFRKRKTSAVPSSLKTAKDNATDNSILSDIIDTLGLDSNTEISDLPPGKLLQYAKRADLTVNGKTGNNITVQDIYGTNTADYENIQNSDITQTDLSLNAALSVADDVSFNSGLYVDGKTKFNSDVSFTSTGRVDVCGNFYAQYPNGSIPGSAIAGEITTGNMSDLTVSGTTTLNSTLEVTKSSVFKGDVSFNSTGRVDVCGNFYAQYPDESIPSSAIVGGGSGGGSVVNANGQTFFDIITQQPGKFTFDSSSNTTANLTINWNYDDIKGKITDTVYQAFLNFQSNTSTKNIPYMDEIQVDISSSNASQSGWIPYQTMNVSNADYHASNYKTLTITKNTGSGSYTNVLNSTDPFDIRVFGKNNAYNYPDENTRGLIFNDVFFVIPGAPSDPVYQSTSINSDSQFTITYNFAEPESGNSNSLGKLNTSEVKYRENETLSSSAYALSTTIQTDTENDENVSGSSNFTTVLQSLRAGTKYDFLTRINNDLTDNYSINDTDWSNVGTSINFDTTNGPTVFTSLPGNNNIYSSSFTPNLSYNNTTYVTTSGFTNSNIIYINTTDSQTLVPSNGNDQIFQISDQSVTTSSTKGFGKYIDDLSNLVQVKAYIDNTVKQTLSYQGFQAGSTPNYGTASRSTHGVNYFNTPTQNDIYSDANRKGHRLKGVFELLTISNDNVETYIGGANSTPYVLKMEFVRDSINVGGTATTNTTSNIYIDTLSSNPSATSTNTAVVTDVIWTMGIPSVKKYKVDCTRTYSDINSSYGFIRGDRKLSSITAVTASSNSTNSTNFSTGNILIDSNSISSDGTYTYDATAFKTANSNNIQSLHYTSARDSTDTTVSITETMYSLKSNGTSNTTTVSVNHHFDKNSYNNYGTSMSSKLSLTDVHEMGAVSNLGSALGSITVSAYTSHTTIPQDHTLLYYNGEFQTSGYPDVTAYTWNSVSGTYTYNASSDGLTTSGSSSTTGTRYKWIAFKLNKVSATQYSFNGSNYTIKTNGDNTKFLSAVDMFANTGLFSSTIISNLFTSGNTNAIGFCRATKNGTSTNVYGYFKNNFNTTQTWTDAGTNATDYSSLTSAKYGCYVANGSDYGIQVSSTAINDDLHVFIGLKI